MEDVFRAIGIPSASRRPYRRSNSFPALSPSTHVLHVSSAPSPRASPSYETRGNGQSYTPGTSSSNIPSSETLNDGETPSSPGRREHPRMVKLPPSVLNSNVQHRVLTVHASNMDAQFEEAPSCCRMEIATGLIRVDIIREQGQNPSIRLWFGQPVDDRNAGVNRE